MEEAVDYINSSIMMLPVRVPQLRTAVFFFSFLGALKSAWANAYVCYHVACFRYAGSA